MAVPLLGSPDRPFSDRTRALPVNDPSDRKLTISCGAALVMLCIAAAAAGYRTRVERFPDGARPDLLAVVTVERARPPVDVAVAAAIPRRRTHRGAFRPDPLPPELVGDVGASAQRHATAITWVAPGPARAAIAELVGQGDRAQFADPRWRRELAAWLRPRRSGDGLTVPRLTGPLTRLAVTHLDLGRRTGAKDETLVRDAPLLGVLWTKADGPGDWLHTGEALGEMLLVTAARGVQAGYVNQPCQVPALRPRLQDALSLAGHAQLVVRFGVPVRAEERSSPRRGDEARAR